MNKILRILKYHYPLPIKYVPGSVNLHVDGAVYKLQTNVINIFHLSLFLLLLILVDLKASACIHAFTLRFSHSNRSKLVFLSYNRLL